MTERTVRSPVFADWLLEYTSRDHADFAGDGRPWGHGTAMARRATTCRDDPKAPGRLDEVTYLLERCHKGKDWPYRRP